MVYHEYINKWHITKALANDNHEYYDKWYITNTLTTRTHWQMVYHKYIDKWKPITNESLNNDIKSNNIVDNNESYLRVIEKHKNLGDLYKY